MKLNAEFFTTPLGNLLLVAAVVTLGGVVLVWQRHRQDPAPLPKPTEQAPPAAMPQTFSRVVAALKPTSPVAGANDTNALPQAQARNGTVVRAASPYQPPKTPPVLPLTLFAEKPAAAKIDQEPSAVAAPYGRLILCQTVVTLESNHIETPVIGLVTADVWNDGILVIPKGAEVHGRASLDRARDRLAAEGGWVIVWRTADALNGTELKVQGVVLDREEEANTWDLHDGSAGLRGEVLRTDNLAEIKLFASTFLSTATTALEDTTTSTSVLGNTIVPSATARNATLAGTSAVLKEYADQIKAAIEKDGIYVRVPAGKAFYLYVTQTLDRSQGRRGTLEGRSAGLPVAVKPPALSFP